MGRSLCGHIGLPACQVARVGTFALAISGCEPGRAAGCDCTVVGHLVRTWHVFKSAHLLIDCFLPRFSEYNCWPARGADRFIRSDAFPARLTRTDSVAA